MIFSTIAVGLSAFASAAAGATITITGLQVATFLGSVAWQQYRQKKLATEMDKRKQVEVAVQGEPFYLPLVYGRGKVAGGVTSVKLSKYFNYAPGTSDPRINRYTNGNALNASHISFNHPYLFSQQAICYGGINRIVDIEVDGKNWDHETLKFGQQINVYLDGNIADPMATANSFPSTNIFSNTCYSSSAYELNRDSYQYNGNPSLSFYVEGMMIYEVMKSGATYYLSDTKTYSNNPARVLLDYLTNPVYGRGLDLSEIDLKSFYNAQKICNTVVIPAVATDGKIFGRRPDEEDEDGNTIAQPPSPDRPLPLYECNMVVDTERSIRDNIELILETMSEAELIWSSGTYKLSLMYPTNEAKQSALVVLEINNDNLVRDTITLTWPDSSTRYAQVTASFKNENENFKDDVKTWPETYSTVYNTYVTEDSGQVLKTEVYLPGTTDPYHAKAKAEQMVRTSRNSYSIAFKARGEATLLEPGDLVLINDRNTYVNGEIFKIKSVKLNEDFTANLEADYHSYTNYAFNAPDDVAYVKKITYYDGVKNPRNVTVSLGAETKDPNRTMKISWDSPITQTPSSYIVDYYIDNSYFDSGLGLWVVDPDTTYLPLGTTTAQSYSITGLETGTYVFRVRSISQLGRLSSGVVTRYTYLDNTPPEPSIPTVTEELYYLNEAAGVKSRLVVSWNANPSSGVVITSRYAVSYRLSTAVDWIFVGETSGTSIRIDDVLAGSYVVRLNAIGRNGYISDYVYREFVALGLTALPADPTNLTLSNGASGQTILSWDPTPDIDVAYGGLVLIRLHPAIDGSATWEAATEVTSKVPGSMITYSVPTMIGTYFIKFIDSTGQQSANFASVVNKYGGFNYTVVTNTVIPNTYTGLKTRCSVISGVLTQDTGTTNMSYYYASNPIDINEVVDVRITPQYVASCTTRGTLVSDYSDISSMTSFSGPVGSGYVRFYVSYSEDNITFTPYSLITSATLTGRYFKIRVNANTADSNSFFQFTSLSLIIDIKNKNYRGNTTTSSSADTVVTFPTPFYGGISGTVVPTVAVTPVGGSSGDNVVVVARSKTSFTVSVYNAGARVVRDIDWHASGI